MLQCPRATTIVPVRLVPDRVYLVLLRSLLRSRDHGHHDDHLEGNSNVMEGKMVLQNVTIPCINILLVYKFIVSRQ